MDKRALSAIDRQFATDEMIEIADQLGGMKFMATVDLVEDKTVVMMHIYRISDLKKGKRVAEFRTFLSKEDYINQKLDTEKVRWMTSSLYMMNDFSLFESHWNEKRGKWDRTELVYIRSKKEKKILCDFFKDYSKKDDQYAPWYAIYRFQDEVKAKRLEVKHRKETDQIDRLMETVTDVPEDFEKWVWEEAMSFSQYLAYKPIGKKLAACECTCCRKKIIVDRNKVRLRNNEKGLCPECGKRVTIKARGKMSSRIYDERWVAYVDPREDGFIWRYFHARRIIDRMEPLNKTEYLSERARSFYTFTDGKPSVNAYEYAEYKQTGKLRWCHDSDKVHCGMCILYPGNLPQAWENTPFRYSALEILAKNVPTTALHYERGLARFMEFPALEWLIKMGLNQIAEYVINEGAHITYSNRLNFSGKTIYDILMLNKVNTRILQEIDGNTDELRLLQAAEQIGMQFKPDQLREYYETFECNTDLIKRTKRKISLHKLVKYIAKESENYPKGDHRGCWMGAYRYSEKEDPRTERKRNMARDWLEYLEWCKDLKYDLDNMFIYMPKNFKKVHDRTAKEYQALQDKKAAAERKRKEREAKKRMEQTKAALAEILETNGENKDAFSLKGKGLILVVPKSVDDIKAEGAALHHCVGTYVERVAKGETSIFFIRKQDAPDKSYYTMEWKNDKVWQCRGLHNCDMTPEVKAFTKAFESIMLETINKGKKKKRKVVPA